MHVGIERRELAFIDIEHELEKCRKENSVIKAKLERCINKRNIKKSKKHRKKKR